MIRFSREALESELPRLLEQADMARSNCVRFYHLYRFLAGEIEKMRALIRGAPSEEDEET